MWGLLGPAILIVILAVIVRVLNRFTYAWIPERQPIVLVMAVATAGLLAITTALGAISRFGEFPLLEALTWVLLLPALMAAVGALMCVAALQIHLLLVDGITAGFHRRAVRVAKRIGVPPLLGSAMFTPVEDLRVRRR